MNLPNKLSLLRIILVPVLLATFLISFPGHLLVTLIIYIVASFTDFLDGYIARKYNLVTDTGKFLDAIADKMLNTTILILIVFAQFVPNPYGIIILFLFISRDMVINMLRMIAASKNVVIQADKWGKYKTFVMCVAIPVILFAKVLYEFGVAGNVCAIISWTGFALLIVATILNCISGVNYMLKNKAVFKEEK